MEEEQIKEAIYQWRIKEWKDINSGEYERKQLNIMEELKVQNAKLHETHRGENPMKTNNYEL